MVQTINGLTDTVAEVKLSREIEAAFRSSGSSNSFFTSSNISTPQLVGTNASVNDPASSISSYLEPAPDLRVRLKPLNADEVYGDVGGQKSILGILRETGGLLFPFTPTISFNQDVNYQSINMTHTNMDLSAYTGTPSVTLSVVGKFTVQNQREGRYAMAVLHFLRTVSKMYFGDADRISGKAGLPPPILVFNGYGEYMFNNLRTILKSHSYTFDDTVDMVTIYIDGSPVRIPALFTISLTLQVQQTPRAMRQDFSLDAFRRGDLMRNNKGGWI